MMLITEEIKTQLLANSAATEAAEGADLQHKPVVKLFGGGACTWLISEMDEHGIMFGLCDLGMGYPELGAVSLAELESIKFQFGLGVERDRYFTADKSLSQYADEARNQGRIAA